MSCLSSKLILVGNLDSILFRQRLLRIGKLLCATEVDIVNTGLGGMAGRLSLIGACLRIMASVLVSKVCVRLVFHGAYSPVLWLAVLLPQVKTVSILQGSELNIDFYGLRAKIIRLILKNSALVVCRNEAQHVQVQSLCGVVADQCQIVHWGLDDSLFTIPRATRRDEVIIISPRATQTLYNIPLIFDVIKKLKRDGCKIRFVYVKFNSRFDADGTGIVDERLNSPPQQSLWQAISDADLCISVPSYDGMSNTVLETLAIGTFPIISDLQQYAFLKQDLRLGMPVTLTGRIDLDTDNIYQTISLAIEQIEEIRASVEFRRDFAARHYQHSKGVNKVIEVLRA